MGDGIPSLGRNMPLGAFALDGAFFDSLSRVSTAVCLTPTRTFFFGENIMLRAFLIAATILGSGVWVSRAMTSH